MNRTVIRAEHLSKRYRLGTLEPYRTLRDAISNAFVSSARTVRSTLTRRPRADPDPKNDGFIWALKDVSLEVKEGEVVGIIGPNGAGKSTLLKIFSRITEPTEGSAEIHGAVGSLLEVGTGFHPELTGRENVYLNGAILGMRKAEIDRKFDDIVDFAELQPFIDTPVKRYSDGMRVRLGFAVAAHLEPEILVVDEVLAVGDASFQRKSLGKMEAVAGEGRTVLFVSHNMAAVQKLCTVAYGLHKGRIFAAGDTNAVITQYLESYDRIPFVPLTAREDRRGTGLVRLTGFSISGAINSSDTVQCGAPARFEVSYEASKPLADVDMTVYFLDQFGTPVLLASSGISGMTFSTIPKRGAFGCVFRKFPLLPGTYRVNLDCSVRGAVADLIRDAVTIHVVEGDYYSSGKLPPRGSGHFAADYDWEILTDPLASSGDGGRKQPSQTGG